jgi:hypothetical protein
MSGAPSCRAGCIRAASPAWTATSRTRRSCAPRAMRCARAATRRQRVRRPQAPPAPGRRQGRAVRHLPHADAELHGHPRPPGPQPAHPASRPLAVARQPECLHQCHTDKQPAVGGERHGQVVRQGLARAPALRHDPACGETQGVRALPGLLELASSPSAPAIVRATAATLAQPYVIPAPAGRPRAAAGCRPVRAHRRARHARAGRPGSTACWPPRRCSRTAVRGVRIEAANVLADVPDSQLPEGRRAARRPRCRNTSTRWHSKPTGPRARSTSATCACGRDAATRRCRLRAGDRPLDPQKFAAPTSIWPMPGISRGARRRRKRSCAGARRTAARRRPAPCAGPAAGAQGRQSRQHSGIRRGRPARAGQCPLRLRASDSLHSAGQRAIGGRH